MTISDNELINRARELAPRIKARAPEAAALRKIHDETIKELLDAQIIQMFVPKRWGGSEASLMTMMEVVEILSAACPSTGWIASFYISHNIYGAKFPEATQEELFGTKGYTLLPAASANDMVARKVDGGWEVSGRAAWGSGIMHADWVLISGSAEDGRRTFLMPASDVKILDNWFQTGMAGTGSNDYVADKVFVPDHRTLTGAEFHTGMTAGSQLHTNPMYSMPFLVAAYCTILPVITGALNGALTAFEEIARLRVRNFSGTVIKDQQHSHIILGELQLATQVASELARGIYRKSENILTNRPFTTNDRLLIKGHTAYISQHSREVANQMMANSGVMSFNNDQPLQRIWRDINTVCSHAFWDWDVSREQIGRRFFDLPFTNPLV